MAQSKDGKVGAALCNSAYLENLKLLLAEAYSQRLVTHDLDEKGNIQVKFPISEDSISLRLSAEAVEKAI